MGDPVLLVCVLAGTVIAIIAGFVICRLICICMNATPLSEEDLTWRDTQ